MTSPKPMLSILARISIERFISEVESGEFCSQQFNVGMVECFREALRIEQEERNDH